MLLQGPAQGRALLRTCHAQHCLQLAGAAAWVELHLPAGGAPCQHKALHACQAHVEVAAGARAPQLLMLLQRACGMIQ